MHTAYIPHTGTHNSKCVCGTLIEISVLPVEVHKEDGIAILVKELHVHICGRACSFNVASARNNCIRALVALNLHSNTYVMVITR